MNYEFVESCDVCSQPGNRRRFHGTNLVPSGKIGLIKATAAGVIGDVG